MSETLKVVDVITFVEPVHLETSLAEVAKKMKEEFTSIVPVVDEQGKLVGVIYAEDLLAPFIPQFFDLVEDVDYITTFGVLDHSIFSDFTHKLFLAADIMRTDYKSLRPEDSIIKAIIYMVREKRTCIVVVDQKGFYKGIVSRLSILNKLYGNGK